jgi:hypothetical protein
MYAFYKGLPTWDAKISLNWSSSTSQTIPISGSFSIPNSFLCKGIEREKQRHLSHPTLARLNQCHTDSHPKGSGSHSTWEGYIRLEIILFPLESSACHHCGANNLMHASLSREDSQDNGTGVAMSRPNSTWILQSRHVIYA